METKSVIAVLGGMVLMYFLAEILEPPLVAWLASRRPATIEEFLVLRNEASVLAGRLALTGVTGLLTGYMVGKIAGRAEVTHAAASAAVHSFVLLRAFAAVPAAAQLPVSTRAAFVAVAVAAMLAGAAIRARAAQALAHTEVRS